MIAILIVILIIGTVLLNIFPYFYGLSLTPSGFTYLGTVHFPEDYFYYLSQLAQGDRHWLFVEYIWGPEHIPASLVGWMYVSTGAVFHFFHIHPIIGYELFLLSSTFIYVLAAFFFLRYIFPEKPGKQFTALLFFIFSNELPRSVYEKVWYNFGEPFVRLDPGPHHLLIHACILILFMLMLSYWSSKTKSKYLLIIPLCLVSMILITIQPIQFGVVMLALGISFLLLKFPRKKMKRFHEHAIEFFDDCFPLIMMTVICLPLLFYMNNIVSIPPYNSGRARESTLQVFMNFFDFFRLYGIVAIVGVVSIPIFLRKFQSARVVISVYTFVALGLFFSPIPQKIGTLNIRFLSVVPVLYFAAAATDGLSFITSYLKRFKHVAFTSCIVLIMIVLLWNFPQEFIWKIQTSIKSPSYYLPTPAYQAIEKLNEVTNADDVILAFWPYVEIVNGLTGKKSFFVSETVTLDFPKKSELAYQFLDNQMTPEAMYSFLQKYNIGTILLFNDAKVSPPSFLKNVYSNELMTVYKVIEKE